VRSWTVPKAGEIHLWRVDLGREVNAPPTLVRALAPSELAKAGKFHSALDRNRYVLAHVGLRTILARYLNTTSGDVVFRQGPHGKPELTGGTVRFNMSHPHDLAVIAISRNCPVGVDIERMEAGVDEELTRCLSPNAHRLLRALPNVARRRVFFQAWTRMEAYAKARGDGLESQLHTLEAFLATSDAHPSPSIGDGDQRRWWLHDFSHRRGYAGAVAAPRANCTLRFWEWRARDIAHQSIRRHLRQNTEPDITSVEEVTHEAV
jgi:4'-phosphopantetheinyl transferase